MKTIYQKAIGTFPPIRIAVPALRINKRPRVSTQSSPQKREDLMSVYRQDLARLIAKQPSGRTCSRAA